MDREWGVPIIGRRRDNKIFELLSLEGAQAGLSWDTILRKRKAYRRAFSGFNVDKVANYTRARVGALLQSRGEGPDVIVKNRAKIDSVVTNARRSLEAVREHGSLSKLLWSFVDGHPRENRWRRKKDIPVTTKEAVAMSKTLKKLGFKFVGPTICYSLMQSIGMVNDHPVGTPQHARVKRIVDGMTFAR